MLYANITHTYSIAIHNFKRYYVMAVITSCKPLFLFVYVFLRVCIQELVNEAGLLKKMWEGNSFVP